MEERDDHLKNYEIAFLAKDEKGAEGVLSTLKGRGAEILLEGPVEKITLAYKIKREMSAYFGYMHFRMPKADVAVIRKDLATHPFILRSLIVTPPFEKQKPLWEGRPRAKFAAPPVAAPQITPESPQSSLPLSNEALEKKIEEILK